MHGILGLRATQTRLLTGPGQDMARIPDASNGKW